MSLSSLPNTSLSPPNRVNLMILEVFLQTLKDKPETIEFDQTMALIDEMYTFTPTSFCNGNLTNKAGENSGSCKIYAFGQLHGLSEEETLACFGHYYREDVLQHPGGTDHQNIRNFIKTGWSGIKFDGKALA